MLHIYNTMKSMQALNLCMDIMGKAIPANHGQYHDRYVNKGMRYQSVGDQ